MKSRAKRRRKDVALPVVDASSVTPRPRRNYARWRAISLSLVYVVFAAHIIHWKITGRTLAPLELNEVMYTLELGVITAGFLFMSALVLGTLIFGRFFCSWACHIIVLQDLCAWVLRKLGIERKPIRSRLLLWVPPCTAFYMFLWPQLVRVWHNKALPTFHFATDAQGWASFVTNNFWRNLPSPPVIVLTFVVCGFVMVYLLGTRTFCTYVCPYGAIFALADRFAPGRIRVSDACKQCGKCTSVCTSGVRVHEEVKQHGMIVNPACLKDLDCVAVCPENALRYTFTAPAPLGTLKSGGRFGGRYDFTLSEELLLAGVFVVVLLSFRGLYSRVPFLLSLALGAIFGYLALLTLRLMTKPRVVLSTVSLKRAGRLTRAGRVFVACTFLWMAVVAHSAFVRYHEYSGLTFARTLEGATNGEDAEGLAMRAHAHLATADRWGLISNTRVKRGLLTTAIALNRFDEADALAAGIMRRYPNDAGIRVQFGHALIAQGRGAEAERILLDVTARWGGSSEGASATVVTAHQALGGLFVGRGDFASAAGQLQTAIRLDPLRARAHAELGGVLAEMGRLDEAIAGLREAVRLDPGLARAQYNLGTLLSHTGRIAEAIPCYVRALAGTPDDAELRNNLGYAYLRTGDVDNAREQLEQALALDPSSADAHFNMATLLAEEQDLDSAAQHFRLAASLDPRYAELLSRVPRN